MHKTRHWDIDVKTKSEAWFMSSFIEQVIPAEGSLWSCYLVSSMDNGRMSKVYNFGSLPFDRTMKQTID